MLYSTIRNYVVFNQKNDCRVFQLLIKLPFMLVLVHETVILFELSVPFLTHQGWQIYNKLLSYFSFWGGGRGWGQLDQE